MRCARFDVTVMTNFLCPQVGSRQQGFTGSAVAPGESDGSGRGEEISCGEHSQADPGQVTTCTLSPCSQNPFIAKSVKE